MSKKNKLVGNSSPKKKSIENGSPKNKFKPSKAQLKKKKIKHLVSHISKAEGNEDKLHSQQFQLKEINESHGNSKISAKKKRKKKKNSSDKNVSDTNSGKALVPSDSNVSTRPDQSVELPKQPKRKKKKNKNSSDANSGKALVPSDSNVSTRPDQSVELPKQPMRKKKKNKDSSDANSGRALIPSDSITSADPSKENKKKKKKNEQNKPLDSAESTLSLSEDQEEIDKGSEIDWDSYPSDTDDEERERRFKKMKDIKVNSDESSEESDISDTESKNSNISEFDGNDDPSDTDDERVKKKGLPINAVPSAEIVEKERRTVFVGNLPYTVERAELKKWFSKFGKVECVRLRSAPIANPEIPRKVAVIKKTFHESRSNIHAYIRFKTVEAANNATQANGAMFKEHIIRVDHSKHEGKYDGKKAVFVGNVPFAVEEDTLRNLFSQCGEIDNVRIVRDKNTGVGKGFAYVNFKCSTSIPLALKLDGEVIEKRELRVKPIKYQKKNAKVNPRSVNPKFRHRNFNKQQDKGHKKTFKSNKFQGEMSKRKMKKPHKKKSAVERKHEKLSKILTNKKEN